MESFLVTVMYSWLAATGVLVAARDLLLVHGGAAA